MLGKLGERGGGGGGGRVGGGGRREGARPGEVTHSATVTGSTPSHYHQAGGWAGFRLDTRGGDTASYPRHFAQL